MSQLKQRVLDKISELGTKKASEYFGKSEATIKGWTKGMTIPLSAVEKVMEDDDVGPIAPEETKIPIQTPIDPHEVEHNQIWDRLNALNTRLYPIENFLREHFPIGMDQPVAESMPPSNIEPIPSRNVPPVITEATIKDNKPAGARSPNSSIQTPMPTAPVMNVIGGPGDWMRPRPLR